jgi:hypothetical protein
VNPLRENGTSIGASGRLKKVTTPREPDFSFPTISGLSTRVAIQLWGPHHENRAHLLLGAPVPDTDLENRADGLLVPRGDDLVGDEALGADSFHLIALADPVLELLAFTGLGIGDGGQGQEHGRTGESTCEQGKS